MEPKLPPNTNENNRRKTMMYTFGDLLVKSPVAFYSYLYHFPQGLQLLDMSILGNTGPTHVMIKTHRGHPSELAKDPSGYRLRVHPLMATS